MYAIRSYYDADKYIVTSYHFSCLFERAYILRGFENALIDFLLNPEFMEELLDKISAFHVELRITSYNVCYTKLLREPVLERLYAADEDV